LSIYSFSSSSTIVNTWVEGAMATTTSKRARLAMADCCSVLVEPIADERATELAKAFAALADPVRLRLFSMIASAGTCCSCDLIEPIGKSQPTVSHHTRVLAEAGLITGEKAGRWVNWTVVPQKLEQLSVALSP
jgi:ArsR family transcriptional regulator